MNRQCYYVQKICCGHDIDLSKYLRDKGLRESVVSEIVESNDVARKLKDHGFTDVEIREIEESSVSTNTERDSDCATISMKKSHGFDDYLKNRFGAILPIALHEIAIKRPDRPIEYLGNWLLHYHECKERERKRREFEEELAEERMKFQGPIIITDQSDEAEKEDSFDDDE